MGPARVFTIGVDGQSVVADFFAAYRAGSLTNATMKIGAAVNGPLSDGSVPDDYTRITLWSRRRTTGRRLRAIAGALDDY